MIILRLLELKLHLDRCTDELSSYRIQNHLAQGKGLIIAVIINMQISLSLGSLGGFRILRSPLNQLRWII